jgi:probable HAF family extracellular repeat protein
MRRALKRFCELFVVYSAFASVQAGHAQVAPEANDHSTRSGNALRYTLIDLGPFGGTDSRFNVSSRILNNRGKATGVSDIATAINPQINHQTFCGRDGFVSVGFFWTGSAIQELDALAPEMCVGTYAINARGEVVGIAENGILDSFNGYSQARAVIWKNGKATDLGTLGGEESLGWGNNDRGDVIGWAETTIPDALTQVSPLGGTETHAVLWSDGKTIDLGTLGGPDSLAIDINNHRQVVGESFTDSIINPATGLPTTVPFLWENGNMTSLGSLGGSFGETFFINERGQVLGDSDLPGDLLNHPTLWDSGHLFDLETGGNGGSIFSVDWLNDEGVVAGAGDFSGEGGPAYGGALWRDGIVTNIDVEDSDCQVEAFAVNNHRAAVGTAACPGESHAWIWSNGKATDLNSVTPENSSLRLVIAVSINEKGEIAGMGVPSGVPETELNTRGHAFLLIPIDCDSDDQSLRHHTYKKDSAPMARDDARKLDIEAYRCVPRFQSAIGGTKRKK